MVRAMSRLAPALLAAALAACTPAEPPLLIDQSEPAQSRAEETAETSDARS